MNAQNQSPDKDLIALGQQVIDLAAELGAEEATAGVYSSVYTDLAQRDGRVETAQESRSLQVAVELLVDGRFSTHSTNDLRPAALRTFLTRAVEATRYLEPDPHRRHADREEMGASDAALDLDDPDWPSVDPAQRRARLDALEQHALSAVADAPVRSLSVNLYDGRVDSAVVTSNGFAHRWQRTAQGFGGSITMEEGDGRLPEAYLGYGARQRSDLPSLADTGAELVARGKARLGSGPIASARMPMLLDARAAGRLLRILIGPLSGTAVYEGRSCLADKLDQAIAPAHFSLWDDPLIPRALGSRPRTGDSLPAVRRPVIEDGQLKMFFLSLYDARRLERTPTSGGPSNLVIPPGDSPPAQLLKGTGPCIRVEGFLGGNTSATTGDFSFGILGTLLEDGQPVRAVSEMNVSGNLFTLMERFQAAADDVWTYSSWRTPSLLFDDIQFSGT